MERCDMQAKFKEETVKEEDHLGET